MKHKKLGKNFSKFYLMGPKLPHPDDPTRFMTCPNGIFIQNTAWTNMNFMSSAPHTSFIRSPFDLELLRIKFIMHMRSAQDCHTEENDTFTKYF